MSQAFEKRDLRQPIKEFESDKIESEEFTAIVANFVEFRIQRTM